MPLDETIPEELGSAQESESPLPRQPTQEEIRRNHSLNRDILHLEQAERMSKLADSFSQYQMDKTPERPTLPQLSPWDRRLIDQPKSVKPIYKSKFHSQIKISDKKAKQNDSNIFVKKMDLYNRKQEYGRLVKDSYLPPRSTSKAEELDLNIKSNKGFRV